MVTHNQTCNTIAEPTIQPEVMRQKANERTSARAKAYDGLITGMYEHDTQECMDKPSIGRSGLACSNISKKKLNKDVEFNEAQSVEHGSNILDPGTGNEGHVLHDCEETWANFLLAFWRKYVPQRETRISSPALSTEKKFQKEVPSANLREDPMPMRNRSANPRTKEQLGPQDQPGYQALARRHEISATHADKSDTGRTIRSAQDLMHYEDNRPRTL